MNRSSAPNTDASDKLRHKEREVFGLLCYRTEQCVPSRRQKTHEAARDRHHIYRHERTRLEKARPMSLIFYPWRCNYYVLYMHARMRLGMCSYVLVLCVVWLCAEMLGVQLSRKVMTQTERVILATTASQRRYESQI